jgi:imidazole glycerol-phosphate synthase subunit HisF
MLRGRIIPCLLIRNGGLVKTVQFGKPKYVGDPINAVRIFNEKLVDELIVLDIDASTNGVEPNYEMINSLAAECRMPLCYGGGIKTLEQVEKIISLGVEKVAISSAAVENPQLLSDAAESVGAQSVVVVLDVKKVGLLRSPTVFTHNGSRNTGHKVLDFVAQLSKYQIGEIVVNSIDHDGMMQGYDLELLAKIRPEVTMPMTVLGGAGSLSDIKSVFTAHGIMGAAAGSLFVFKGRLKAVLISYPSVDDKAKLVQQ